MKVNEYSGNVVCSDHSKQMDFDCAIVSLFLEWNNGVWIDETEKIEYILAFLSKMSGFACKSKWNSWFWNKNPWISISLMFFLLKCGLEWSWVWAFLQKIPFMTPAIIKMTQFSKKTEYCPWPELWVDVYTHVPYVNDVTLRLPFTE